MAAPLTAAAFLTALHREGVRTVEVGSWRTHSRNHKGAWGPVHGIVVHHTVTAGTQSSVDLCRNGYTDLPGPLCHGVIAKDGRVHLIGYGRANHAGSGDSAVLDAVIRERGLPRPAKNDADGNARFYGFECINLGNGKDPWPEAQLEAIERACAALCRTHGWTAASVLGHREWTNTKVDPVGFAMADLRARITRRLSGEPSGPPDPAPVPFPGRAMFRPGAVNEHVTRLGEQLVRKGFDRHYTQGPGPRWSENDRRNVADFQRSRPELAADADGYPGPLTWQLLFS